MSAGLLCIERSGRILAVRPLGTRPLLIGRDEGCDVVLPEADVSRQHLLVWLSGSGLRVRDLWSTYGSAVGGLSLRPGETAPWPEGATVTLASEVRLTTAPLLGPASDPPVRLLEDLETGLLLRLPLGDFPLWTPQGVARLRSGPGSVTVEEPTGAVRSLPAGREVSAAGRPVRLHEDERPADPVTSSIGLPFHVRFFSGEGGRLTARFEGIRGDTALRIVGDQRVALIERLAREQLRVGRVPAWVPDRSLASAVWGPGAPDPGPRINTLVSRIRRTLEEAGLPRALIMKEDGRTALSVVEVSLPDPEKPQDGRELAAAEPLGRPPPPDTPDGSRGFLLTPGSADRAAGPLAELPRRALLLGRSGRCDVVIPDLRVSRRQALVWVEAGHAWVRALPGGNGTQLDGHPLGVGEIAPWGPTQTLSLAGACSFHLRPGASTGPPPLLVLDADAGVQLNLGREPLPLTMPRGEAIVLVSAAGGADVRVGAAPPRRIVVGEAVPLAGRRLAPAPLQEQARPERTGLGPPFVLRVSVGGPGGTRAEFEDLLRDRVLEMRGATRVSLLYVLARRASEAAGHGFGPWVDDADLARGIWGARSQDARARLNVVLSRIRSRLEEEGFPPGLLQKEAGRTRLVIGRVELV